MTLVVVIEAFAIALLGLLVCGLLRSHGEILRRLHEMGVGLDPDGTAAAPAPKGRSGPANTVELSRRRPSAPAGTGAFDVVGLTLTDETVKIGVVGARQSTLLAFLSSGCASCGGFWAALSDGARLSMPGGARLVIVTRDPSEESESQVRELAADGAPVVMSSEAWRDYDVPGAPFFVYVDGPSGRVVGQGAAQTWEQVSTLWSRALEDEALADRDLMRAGIHPGHASLYPPAPGDDRATEE